MCWHKWSKWVVVQQKYYYPKAKDKDGNLMQYMGSKQTRKCLKCNYTQEEEL